MQENPSPSSQSKKSSSSSIARLTDTTASTPPRATSATNSGRVLLFSELPKARNRVEIYLARVRSLSRSDSEQINVASWN